MNRISNERIDITWGINEYTYRSVFILKIDKIKRRFKMFEKPKNERVFYSKAPLF